MELSPLVQVLLRRSHAESEGRRLERRRRRPVVVEGRRSSADELIGIVRRSRWRRGDIRWGLRWSHRRVPSLEEASSDFGFYLGSV